MFATINALLSDAKTVAVSGISLAILVFAFFAVKRAGFTLVSIVSAIITFGLVAWFVIGQGVFKVQEKMDQDINAAAGVVRVADWGTA